MGLFRYRADFVGKLLLAWARLGPLGMQIVRGLPICTRTVGSRQFRRDRSPNGVAWRFPDWTAMGFRSSDRYSRPPREIGLSQPSHRRVISRNDVPHAPGPVPEDQSPFAWRYHQTLATWVRRDGDLKDSLLQAERVTGGDSNPACLSSVFSARLVPDGLTPRPCERVWTLARPSLAADSRRARNSLASHGSTVAWEPDSVSGAFSFFAGRFPARRRGEIYRDTTKARNNSTSARFSYPRDRARRSLRASWAVQKSVD